MINKMATLDLPLEVTEDLSRIGQRLRTARIRRGWSVADLAARAGINRNTLTALEQGKPGTSFGSVLTVLWVLGLERSAEPLADPETDLHGKALEAARRPERVGRQPKARDEYDF